MSASSRKAAGNKNIRTVHDVPLMPETRAVRRLHHSAEAICLELPQQSYHQCDQCSNPSCGDGVFSDERSCLKLVANYYTTMLTKFKNGVGSATIILKLQEHLPGT